MNIVKLQDINTFWKLMSALLDNICGFYLYFCSNCTAWCQCKYPLLDWASAVLEKAMAPPSSTLTWKIPWTEEPGGLQSDMTERLHFHFSLSCIGEGNGNPLQCSCLENPGTGKPGGLLSMGSHRVGHDWSDLAAAEGDKRTVHRKL